MGHKSRLGYAIAYASALILFLSLIYYKSVIFLVDEWLNHDEYSHGPLLVIIVFYILWKKRAQLYAHIGESSWIGPLIIFIGLVLAIGSIQGDIVKATNYSAIIVLMGIALSLGGRRLLKDMLFPLFLLFMTIPLPYLVNVILTRKLQFISSELGAWFIGLFNIPVYLEGNVLELENYTLLVEEACSGLNYLYALVSIGVIWSYFFKAPRWQKAVLVLSTIPIAVFMNGARVGVTGILVHTSGIESAEGFLHEFEGLLVFLATCLLLVPIVWLLALLQKRRPAFSRLFDFQLENTGDQHASDKSRIGPAALLGLVLIGLASIVPVSNSGSVIPQRMSFSSFPSKLGDWKSSTENLPAIIQDVLKADDYYLADFKDKDGDVVNLYMVYYNSQFRQKAIHSPLVCLPGSGWVIEKEEHISITSGNSNTLQVNKLLINRDGNKQLVYYWIQQQGNSFANDFLARASLLGNALLNNRTDSALVRLTTPVLEGDLKRSENTLDVFLSELNSKLHQYIPN